MTQQTELLLPVFRNGEYPVAQVKNVNRKEPGALPPLMDDVRATNLLEYSPPASDIVVYLKAVGSPYTGEHGIHFLTIPDRIDHKNIPGIENLENNDLTSVLQFAEAVSRHALDQPGISEVDFGWHHSRGELKGIPKQRVATFPQNLHIHTIAFSAKDLEKVDAVDVLNNPDLRGRTGEALHKLGEELFFEEIVPELKEEYPTFPSLLQEVQDSRGRRRFKVVGGKESFINPQFAQILKSIDFKGKQLYDEIARCFFEYDAIEQKFVVKDDSNARFKLLPAAERNRRVKEYTEQKTWLSRGVKLGLAWLAYDAKDEGEIIQRELDVAREKNGSLSVDQEKKVITDAANRFWAYKDFSYSISFSAKRSTLENKLEWVFAFDPKIFSVEGIVQSSAFTDKWITKDNSSSYTPDQLASIQAMERVVINATREEDPLYVIGPGIALNA